MRIAARQLAACFTSALLVALLIARQIGESQVGNDYYQLAEWRIFYPGHFIRRGLRGSVVGWLSHVTGLNPETIVRWFCTLGYAALTVVFTVYLFRWLWDKARAWIPILLISPAGLFFYQDAILSIERFDVFFLLLTVCHLEVCIRAKDEKKYAVWAIALFSTLGVGAVLCHEAFLLLCMPVNVMLSTWRLGRWDARLLLIYGLPSVAGCFCVFSHVSPLDVAVLSHDLGMRVGSFEWYNGPILLLALSPSQQMAMVRSFFSLDAVRPFLAMVLIFGSIHFGVLWNLFSSSDMAVPARGWLRPNRRWRDLFWIPFVCTLPLYVVGADYGRWFVMAVATFTICSARLLQVRTQVKRLHPFWTVTALIVFAFVPIPVLLRFPHSSPQLLTWSGAATLGHIYGAPHPVGPSPRNSQPDSSPSGRGWGEGESNTSESLSSPRNRQLTANVATP